MHSEIIIHIPGGAKPIRIPFVKISFADVDQDGNGNDVFTENGYIHPNGHARFNLGVIAGQFACVPVSGGPSNLFGLPHIYSTLDGSWRINDAQAEPTTREVQTSGPI